MYIRGQNQCTLTPEYVQTPVLYVMRDFFWMLSDHLGPDLSQPKYFFSPIFSQIFAAVSNTNADNLGLTSAAI